MCEHTSKHPVCCRHHGRTAETDGSVLRQDLWVSKYIKWKLSCDLVICQVSRDKRG